MRKKPVKLGGWPLGINNTSNATKLSKAELRDAVDVDLDDDGLPTKRLGRTSRYAGSGCHSIYAFGSVCVFVEGSSLKRLNLDWSTSVLSSITPNLPVSYDEMNNEIYYSNGVDTGIISSGGVVRSWGVPHPLGQPLLASSIVGSLTPGQYQVAITFVSASGEESGAALSNRITLTGDTGGINLTLIPQHSDAAYVRIYATNANGNDLRYQTQIPMGVTTFLLSSIIDGELLQTQFMLPMPAGTIVRSFHGRMYVVSENYLFYSLPLRYGLHDPRFGYKVFPAPITMLQAVDTGLFVGADRCYFLAGKDPEEMEQLEVLSYPAIPGTGLSVSSKLFDPELAGDVRQELAYWVGKNGPVLGLPSGNAVELTERRLALPEYDAGTSLVREQAGIRQVVSALYGTGEQSKFTMGDEVQVEVVRNGITLS